MSAFGAVRTALSRTPVLVFDVRPLAQIVLGVWTTIKDSSVDTVQLQMSMVTWPARLCQLNQL